VTVSCSRRTFIH